MNPHELDSLGTTLRTLALGYQETFPLDREAVYLQILSPLPLERVLYACEAWAMSPSAFFPKPGQLYSMATTLPNAPQASEVLEARAAQAWGNLRGTNAPYNAWALEDPITKQVFRIMGGGYRTESGFGMWDIKEESYKRREFIATYLDLAKHAPRLLPLPSAPKQLPAPPPLADDDGSDEEDAPHPDVVKRLLRDLSAKLALPPVGVPVQYLREPREVNSRVYTPSLTSQELQARRTLLFRQAQQLMSQDIAVRMDAEQSVTTDYDDEPWPEPPGED